MSWNFWIGLNFYCKKDFLGWRVVVIYSFINIFKIKCVLYRGKEK